MDSAVTAIVGALILLALGWLKLDINRLADKIDRLDQRLTETAERLGARIDALSERVAHIEGRLDEREHH